MVSRHGQHKMGKTSDQNQAQALTRLLRRINQGADPKRLRKEASQLISCITSKDIAVAEQNLIDNGYTPQLAGQLSSVFVLLGILEEQGGNLKDRLPENHILRQVLAEHELIRCFMANFKDVAQAIGKMDHLADTSAEFMKLSHIVEHLNAMDEHIEREEYIIFPWLKRYGWGSLCRSAHSDHDYIRIAIEDLLRLVGSFNEENLKEFKARLNSINKYLCPAMAEHLFHEDNILYPIVLGVIDDDKVWKKMKAVCDQIGFCGVHL